MTFFLCFSIHIVWVRVTDHMHVRFLTLTLLTFC